MERLTEWCRDHWRVKSERVNGKLVTLQMCFDKLADYEDAEEQGLLLRLPVAIGSTLYQKRKDNMIEFKTLGIIYDISSKEWLYEVAVQSGVDWIKTVCSMECVGKTVFLTKEEAEQALKHTENAR